MGYCWDRPCIWPCIAPAKKVLIRLTPKYLGHSYSGRCSKYSAGTIPPHVCRCDRLCSLQSFVGPEKYLYCSSLYIIVYGLARFNSDSEALFGFKGFIDSYLARSFSHTGYTLAWSACRGIDEFYDCNSFVVAVYLILAKLSPWI